MFDPQEILEAKCPVCGSRAMTVTVGRVARDVVRSSVGVPSSRTIEVEMIRCEHQFECGRHHSRGVDGGRVEAAAVISPCANAEAVVERLREELGR